MQISTKTGYAVRALSELVLSSDGKPVSMSEICRKQNLPIKYIEQLFRKLRKKEIIKSIHGSRGGYLLNKPISEVSLKDIMHALDDDFSNKFCYGSNAHSEYCTGFPCGFYELWDDIKNFIEDYLDTIKLEQIISRLQEKK